MKLKKALSIVLVMLCLFNIFESFSIELAGQPILQIEKDTKTADENVTKTVFKALHIIEVVFELNTNRFDELTELFNSIFSFIEKFIEVFEFLANDKKS